MNFGSKTTKLTWTKCFHYGPLKDLYLCDSIVKMSCFDKKSNIWETSELRRWLNGEFYKEAFSDYEKRMIEKNREDFVFLLSIEDFKKASNLGLKSFTVDRWWLKDSNPKDNNSTATAGSVIGSYYYVYSDTEHIGVRPAILLSSLFDQKFCG